MQNGCHVHQLDLATMTRLKDVHYTDNLERHLSYGFDILDSTSKFYASGEGILKNSVNMTFASCSFYDKKVDIWKARFEEVT